MGAPPSQDARGRSADHADRELFHGLRATVDAVLVGAGTVRTERYGRIIPDAARRELRRQRGLSEEPLACIVSGRLALDEDIPLLAEPSARVVMLTRLGGEPARRQEHSSTTSAAPRRDASISPRALRELRERFAVELLLCEGGPHLCQPAARRGFGSMSCSCRSRPNSRAVSRPSGEALRILAGSELEPTLELELLSVLCSDSSLFLRYGTSASARERVSRETIANSSLAR